MAKFYVFLGSANRIPTRVALLTKTRIRGERGRGGGGGVPLGPPFSVAQSNSAESGYPDQTAVYVLYDNVVYTWFRDKRRDKGLFVTLAPTFFFSVFRSPL